MSLILGSAAAAAAPLKTGADLAAACRDAENPGICLNYLLVVADGHDAFANFNATGPQWCRPPNTNHRVLRQVYLSFVDARREVLKLPANEAVAAAFTAKFPCKDVLPDN